MAKVAIFGPGALGCLVAARLCQSGTTVFLVDYKEDRMQRLNETGIQVKTQEGVLSAHPNVVLNPPQQIDLAIVLTKSYQTGQLPIPQHVPVLTLQNGLGNVEKLCSMVGSANVIAGTTTEAASLVAPGEVLHAGSGVTTIGSWTSCPINKTATILENAGFQVRITSSPGQAIWEKAAIVCAINPLTALLNVPNGALLEIPLVRQLLRDLVVESTKVASTEGYRFERSLLEAAEEVCFHSKDNISSMLQDVRAGRKTEIEALSGEVVRRAVQVSLPTPRTRVIYQLLKGLESSEDFRVQL